MRQTVTGRFRTWDDARHAQDVLMLQGFAADDIELPAHASGVLAGIERLVSSFFASSDPYTAGTGEPGAAPSAAAPGDAVVLAVHVSDDAHADRVRATLSAERALDIATRGDAWNWPSHDDAGARERSAIDELGLGDLAAAVRRRATSGPSSATADEASVRRSAVGPIEGAGTGQPASTSAAVASASAPGAGAVMGNRVEVPGAPEATRPAKDAAPQIPDEFLEYEDDTPAHHRTLH